MLQERLARRLAKTAGVRVLPCPFDVVPLNEALWWHPIYQNDRAHLWLRGVVAEAGRELSGHQPGL
jgi:DNA-binding transcriptional LysR family regulator